MASEESQRGLLITNWFFILKWERKVFQMAGFVQGMEGSSTRVQPNEYLPLPCCFYDVRRICSFIST